MAGHVVTKQPGWICAASQMTSECICHIIDMMSPHDATCYSQWDGCETCAACLLMEQHVVRGKFPAVGCAIRPELQADVQWCSHV
jgi:hypothetical protein